MSGASTAQHRQERRNADPRARWIAAFRNVRDETERRCAPLSAEDQVIQSMPDTSPAKWHRAHTTWFFEQFLLRERVADYLPYDDRFAYLFNSYYVAAGPRHARPQRGLVTRPDADEVSAYRAHVDRAVETMIADADETQLGEIARVLEIGLNHEQQHQELILTDILHAFSQNPTCPMYDLTWQMPETRTGDGFAELPGGIYSIGHEGAGFHFDNERPAHRAMLRDVSIARGVVTNGEWLNFIEDGGYTNPALWLSDGWATVQAEGWDSPGYWRKADGAWFAFTLGGLRPVDPAAAVCHVSYYEADAFARWAGKDLPTESEWEVAERQGLLDDSHGLVWQWTRSAYDAYPGYKPLNGALGEYNGKFMINQMVLRGSSLATPDGHSRATYRNFFHPPARWQFAGLRLASYA